MPGCVLGTRETEEGKALLNLVGKADLDRLRQSPYSKVCVIVQMFAGLIVCKSW